MSYFREEEYVHMTLEFLAYKVKMRERVFRTKTNKAEQFKNTMIKGKTKLISFQTLSQYHFSASSEEKQAELQQDFKSEALEAV